MAKKNWQRILNPNHVSMHEDNFKIEDWVGSRSPTEDANDPGVYLPDMRLSTSMGKWSDMGWTLTFLYSQFRRVCPHEVRIKRNLSVTLPDWGLKFDAANWCRANCKHYWTDTVVGNDGLKSGYDTFLFQDSNEAIMFKLLHGDGST